MKTLDLSFKTSTNKVHHLKLHYANDNLSKDVVSKAMADLAAHQAIRERWRKLSRRTACR